jgi:hypothetical protein
MELAPQLNPRPVESLTRAEADGLRNGGGSNHGGSRPPAPARPGGAGKFAAHVGFKGVAGLSPRADSCWIAAKSRILLV